MHGCRPAYNRPTSRLLEFQDGVFQFVEVCPGELLDLLGALDEYEGRHRVDVVLGCDVLALVHVDLEYDDGVRHLVGDLLQLGPDHLAWPAPGGHEVDHHQLLTGLGQPGLQVIGVFDVDGHFTL